MFKRHLIVFHFFENFFDFFTVILSFVLAIATYKISLSLSNVHLEIHKYFIQEYFIVGLALIYPILLTKLGGRQLETKTFRLNFYYVILSNIYFSFICMAVFFIFGVDINRLIFLIFILYNILLSSGVHFVFRIILRIFYSHINPHTLLVVGTGKNAQKYVRTILEEKYPWLVIVGYITRNKRHIGKQFHGINVRGMIDKFETICKRYVIDELLIIEDKISDLDRDKGLMILAEELGIKVTIVSDLFHTFISRLSIEKFKDTTVLSYNTIANAEVELFLKRLFDISFSLIFLLITLPITVLTVILIKIFSPQDSVFYIQKRSTLHGRRFNVIKFRSMVPNADKMKDVVGAKNEMDGPVFKMKKDPRVIPLIGTFIRKLSIDEIPQFWNVLKGEMSVVGPRPPIPEEVDKYENWQRRRLSMRPGVTCLWQIGGRNRLDFDTWMNLDLEYIDNWSLWLDLKILMKTIPVVLFGYGAE